MRIDIEDIRKMQDFRDKVNRAPLAGIEFFENGVVVELDPKDRDNFVFCGMTNMDFITSWAYKRD